METGNKLRLFIKSVTVLTLILSSYSIASADCQTAPGDTGVVAAPSRPNYANTADILQEGVTEFEDGYSHSWIGPTNSQSDVPALIRFALSCNIEVRFGSDNLIQLQQDGATTRGIGDSWLTGQYEFWHSTPKTPSLAFAYGLKIPTASASKGLGTGLYDHAFTFLANKNLGTTALAFNVQYTLAGATAHAGFDRSTFIAGNFARPLVGPIGITGELYGATRLNEATRGYTGTLWALTYTRNPRLVFDAGVDLGLTPGTPHLRAYAGVSYAIGEAYSSLRAAKHHPEEE